MAREKTRTKRKEKKNIATGVAHVNSSFNNTKILISDVQGNALAKNAKTGSPTLPKLRMGKLRAMDNLD